MERTDFLNVFQGPQAVADYYNPDLQPPLPLVEVPQSLNPFRQDGVRIFAKMMTALPAHNVKSLPGKHGDDFSKNAESLIIVVIISLEYAFKY
jgi:hypothetical protein